MSLCDVQTLSLANEFRVCKLHCMTISEYREHLNLTQEAFASAIGLKSKGQVSIIERANSCSVNVALAIEAHSNGLVDAATLNADVAAARKVAA